MSDCVYVPYVSRCIRRCRESNTNIYVWKTFEGCRSGARADEEDALLVEYNIVSLYENIAPLTYAVVVCIMYTLRIYGWRVTYMGLYTQNC